ncbi:MAG: hypothetical protein QOE06_1121 [Thermoleophilaceae bacterium]|nr:hypothetical protein [Thermoleophilaceae bacterium]
MSAVGTLDWARRTGGRLTASERLAFTATGVASQMRQMSDRAAFSLGLSRDRLARLDLSSVRLPDSAAAREAEQFAEELPPFIWHHSQRSYLWALALASMDALTPDEEFLYVSCLMHDAGMFGVGDRESSACFTLGSADAASRCAVHGGWDDARRERLMEAITLHINPSVAVSEGVEANLLTRGSTLDGFALRGAWRIAPETKRDVLERHPRHGMTGKLPPVLRAHGREAPKGRIAFYLRYGALVQLIKHSPWDD